MFDKARAFEMKLRLFQKTRQKQTLHAFSNSGFGCQKYVRIISELVEEFHTRVSKTSKGIALVLISFSSPFFISINEAPFFININEAPEHLQMAYADCQCALVLN